ncbi:MAG: flagellar protein FlaG [bacterium]
MATIENLGAAPLRQMMNRAAEHLNIRRTVNRAGKKPEIKIPANKVGAVKLQEGAQLLKASPDTGNRANERKTEPIQTMSLDELAAMLRKVNLTFDLFEIQARFIVDRETGEISVEVVNQRTGEVIRKIPPYDIPKVDNLLSMGEALLTDVRV